MDSSALEIRLQESIAAYLEELQAGRSPDRSAWLARDPDLADELRAYFADHDKMTQAAAPVRAVLEDDCRRTASPVPAETFPQTFGDYELLEEIGRGGMGIVYKARQTSLIRIVALKRIRAGQLASPEEVARFRREAKAAAGLDHPHIVPILEVGEQDGQHFFTMKLIEGGSLGGHLARFADAKASAELMIKIARAVHHAHQRGIVHRDLKPSNILIDADGHPHVSDFGLAQPIEKEAKLTQSGAIVGTAEYMAPEQARGEKGLTTAADVYGLGAILYVLLSGKPPFQGDYNWETLKKVVEDEPVSPRSLNRKANRDLETICLHCLEKQAAKRYGSADALVADLENWQLGKPISVQPTGWLGRSVKWTRRHPAQAALVAVICLATTTVLTGGLYFNWRLRNEIDKVVQQGEELGRQGNELIVTRQNLGQALSDAKAKEKAAGEILEGFRWLKETRQLNAVNDSLKDPLRAFELLHDYNLCPIDRRGTVWHLLHNACRKTQTHPSVSFPLDPKKKFAPYRMVASADKKSLAIFGAFERREWSLSFLDLTTSKVEMLRHRIDENDRFTDDAAFSPDGKTIAIGHNIQPKMENAKVRCRIELAAVPGGKRVKVFAELEKELQALAFSPDGKWLVAGFHGGSVHRWNVQTGEEVAVLATCDPEAPGFENYPDHWQSGVTNVAFSPNGEYLVGTSLVFRGWRVRDEFADGKGHNRPQDARSRARWEICLRVWPLSEAKKSEHAIVYELVDVLDREWSTPHGRPLLTISADSQTVAVSTKGRFACVYRLNPLTLLSTSIRATTRESDRQFWRAIALSPDGATFAAAQQTDDWNPWIRPWIGLWDVASSRFRGRIELDLADNGNNAAVPHLSYDVAGDNLIGYTLSHHVNAYPDQIQQVKWPMRAVPGQLFPGDAKGSSVLALSPDGKLLATAGPDNSVALWSFPDGAIKTKLKGHIGPVTCVAFSSDGKTLASGSEDRTVILWDLVDGTKKWTSGYQLWRDWEESLPRPEYLIAQSAAAHMAAPAASPIGAMAQLVVAAKASRLELFVRGHSLPLKSVAFTHRDMHVIGIGDPRGDRTQFRTRIWDTADGTPWRGFDIGGGLGVAVATNPMRNRVAIASEGRVSVFVEAENRLIQDFAHPGIQGLQYSRDGKKLLTWSPTDFQVHDVSDEKEARKIMEGTIPEGNVVCAAFDPNESVFIGGTDGVLRLWDIAQRQERIRLPAHRGSVRALVLDGNGQTLISAGADGAIKVWDLSPSPLQVVFRTPQKWFAIDANAQRVFVEHNKAYSVETGASLPGFQFEAPLTPPDLVWTKFEKGNEIRKITGALKGMDKEGKERRPFSRWEGKFSFWSVEGGTHETVLTAGIGLNENQHVLLAHCLPNLSPDGESVNVVVQWSQEGFGSPDGAQVETWNLRTGKSSILVPADHLLPKGPRRWGIESHPYQTSPDGRLIITADSVLDAERARRTPLLRVFNSRTGTKEAVIPLALAEVEFLFPGGLSPDGRLLFVNPYPTAGSDYGGIRCHGSFTAGIVDFEKKRQLPLPADHYASPAIDPGSKLLILRDSVRLSRLVLWDWTTKTELCVLEHPAPVKLVGFSADGCRLVTYTWDYRVWVWNIPRKR